MVESLNTKVDFVIDATSFSGLTDYGKIMIGDKGFEFYHGRDPRKFIQIPWEEVDYVVASVFFKGKWIPRYGIQTKKNGTFIFSSKKPKKVLRELCTCVIILSVWLLRCGRLPIHQVKLVV